MEDGEREKHFREGGARWIQKQDASLLISKRKSCLKSGCLAALAANATSRLRDEILFSEELRGVIGTYRNPPCDKNPVAKCFPLDVYAEFIYYNLIFLHVFR